MKEYNKEELKNQKKRLPKDSGGTVRIMKLIKAYQSATEGLYEYMALIHQHKQRACKIARNIREELTVNSVTAFKIKADYPATVKILSGKSRAVIDAGDVVPEDYVSVRTQRAYDMKRIEEDLKQGKHIPGVHLESLDSVNINLPSTIAPSCSR